MQIYLLSLTFSYGEFKLITIIKLKGWIIMEKYIGTIIVAAIIILVCVLAIRSMVKDKKSGKSVQCGGNCNNCHGCH